MKDSKYYLILFGDLIGSTQVSVEASPSFFARNYIASFHWATKKAQEFINNDNIYERLNLNFTGKISPIKIKGDEVISFSLFEHKRDKEYLQDLAASAVTFAVITKLYWLASPYNLQRMMGKQFPRDIAIGIHIGPADEIPYEDPANIDIASLHINITKRIEENARKGEQSRIFASYDVADWFREWRDRFKKIEPRNTPPILFTEFSRQPIAIYPEGVPKKIQLLELIQAETPSMLELFEHLSTTPERVNDFIEIIAKRLADTFLPGKNGYPFYYLKTKKNRAIDCYITDIGTKKLTVNKYIKCWFDAVKSQLQSKVFSNEQWLLLEFFFISCALMRHRSIIKDIPPLYKDITNKIFHQLHTVLEQQKKE